MSNIARDHHFVPEFVLGNFAATGTAQGCLWVTDTLEIKGYWASPNKAGFQKDLYRIDVDGVRPDKIETTFGQFEGVAAPIVRQLMDDRVLPARPGFDRLMEFVGLLFLRVPGKQKRANKILDQRLKRLFRPLNQNPEMLKTTLGRMRAEGVQLPGGQDYDSIDIDELYRFGQDESRYTLSIDKEHVLAYMLRFSAVVQGMLMDRKWTILVPAIGAGDFVCSDAPVSLAWSDCWRLDRLPQLHENGTDITVPLGKTIALRGRYETNQPSLLVCDRAMVARVNKRTICSRDRFLYSNGKQFPYECNNGSIGWWVDLIVDLRVSKEGKLARKGVRDTRGPSLS